MQGKVIDNKVYGGYVTRVRRNVDTHHRSDSAGLFHLALRYHMQFQH